MFLTRLREFAESSDAMPPPFHARRSIRWMLDLHPDGRPDGELVDLAVPDEPARRNGKRELVPNLQRSGTAPQPMLACDDLKNALGWPSSGKGGRPADPKDLERACLCHAAFTTLVAEWAEASPRDRGARALLAFLRSDGQQDLARPAKYSSSDLVAFRVNGRFVHLSLAAKRRWTHIATCRKASEATGMCLVCGRTGQLIDTFPRQVTAGLIPAIGFDPDSRSKNRPQPNSVALASVNKESMGFDLTIQLAHSPICVSCAEASVAALDHLLRSRDHNRRIGDTALTWWLLHAEPGTAAPIQLVFEPDEAAIDALLAETPTTSAPEPEWLVKTAGTIIDAPKSGREPGRVDTSLFCAAAMSANKTRLVLRDWIDVPLPAAKQAVARWFTDHSVLDPWTGAARRYSLYRLTLAFGRWDRQRGSYLPLGDSGAHRPLWAQRDLLAAALHENPPPVTLAHHLVQRLRADRHLDGPRQALLKLLIRRTFRPDKEIRLTLDETDDTPAYLAGRLFAVLESLQFVATRLDSKDKKLNTTLADRYLAAASTSPARVVPELLRGSQAHLKKLRSRNRDGLAVHYAKQRDDLSARLKPIPLALGLADQCSWFNGYADQRNHFFALAAARGQRTDDNVPEIPDTDADQATDN
jgi:CRISPR-associated protein Csd1